MLKDLSKNSPDPKIVKKTKSAIDAIEGLNRKLVLQEKEEEEHEEEKNNQIDSLKEHEERKDSTDHTKQETKKPERDYFSKSAFVRKYYDK